MGILVALQPLATTERFGQSSFGRATEASVAGALVHILNVGGRAEGADR